METEKLHIHFMMTKLNIMNQFLPNSPRLHHLQALFYQLPDGQLLLQLVHGTQTYQHLGSKHDPPYDIKEKVMTNSFDSETNVTIMSL